MLWMLAACGRINFGPIGGADDDGTGDANGDTSGSNSPPMSSGTRLRALKWVAGDGFAWPAGEFYDPVMKARCAFEPDVAGTPRCFPVDATLAAYSDASCTIPVVRAPPGCSMPTVATDSSGTYDVAYAVGAPIAPSQVFVRGFGCFPAAAGSAAYYEVGAQIADSEFVAATTSPAPLAGSFARSMYVGEDGSRQELGAQYQGADCTLQTTAGGGGGACIPAKPSLYQATPTYLDAACTMEAIPIVGTPPPFITIDRGLGAPCRRLRYVQTGATTNVTRVYYRASGGGCSSFTVAATDYTQVSDVGGTLPTLTHVVDSGTTRLRGHAWVTATGDRFYNRIYDTQLTAACLPAIDSTGHATCAPLGDLLTTSLWTGTNCNGPAPQGQVACNGDDTFFPQAVLRPRPGYATCQGTGEALVTYTTQLASQAAYTKLGNNCVAMDLSDAVLYDTSTTPYDPAPLETLTLQ